MNELQIFNSEEFGDIRTVTIENDPWFVGKDVAKALGYGDGKSLNNAVANHVSEEDNINEFGINGYPKSQKDFKDFIAGIIDEDIFTLITNPAAFNALPWKKQREILMKFVGTFSDAEIAETFGERYTKLIPELRIASTEDILKKYTKAKTALNKDMVEIPARIDEISKQLVIADVGALEVEKAAKEVALQKVEDEISGGNNKLEEINSKREEIMNLKLHGQRRSFGKGRSCNHQFCL